MNKLKSILFTSNLLIDVLLQQYANNFRVYSILLILNEKQMERIFAAVADHI